MHVVSSRGILFCSLRALLRKREYKQEMIQSVIGRTRTMTSSGQRTALSGRTLPRSVAPTDLREECDIVDDKASLLLFVSRSARLGIVPMSLSRVVAISWKSYDALSCKEQLRKSVQDIVIACTLYLPIYLNVLANIDCESLYIVYLFK